MINSILNLQLVGIEHIVLKSNKEPKIKYTFLNSDNEILEGYLDDEFEEGQEPYLSNLTQIVGKLNFDKSKAFDFPFVMKIWEGKQKFYLQSPTN